jgi:hypothetical protein
MQNALELSDSKSVKEELRTEQKLILVDHIPNAKVDGAEYHDERLDNAVQHRNHKHEDRLRVHHPIVDHRRRVQLRKI